MAIHLHLLDTAPTLSNNGPYPPVIHKEFGAGVSVEVVGSGHLVVLDQHGQQLAGFQQYHVQEWWFT